MNNRDDSQQHAASLGPATPWKHLSALKKRKKKIKRSWSSAAPCPPTQTDRSSADTGWSALRSGSALWASIGWLPMKAAWLLDGLPAGRGADPSVWSVQAGTPPGPSSVEEVWRDRENIPEVNRWRPEEPKVPSGSQVNGCTSRKLKPTETAEGICRFSLLFLLFNEGKWWKFTFTNSPRVINSFTISSCTQTRWSQQINQQRFLSYLEKLLDISLSKRFSRSPVFVLHTSIMGSFHISQQVRRLWPLPVPTGSGWRDILSGWWMVGEGLTLNCLAVRTWAGLNIYPNSPLFFSFSFI